jgi:hypothetical protein
MKMLKPTETKTSSFTNVQLLKQDEVGGVTSALQGGWLGNTRAIAV